MSDDASILLVVGVSRACQLSQAEDVAVVDVPKTLGIGGNRIFLWNGLVSPDGERVILWGDVRNTWTVFVVDPRTGTIKDSLPLPEKDDVDTFYTGAIDPTGRRAAFAGTKGDTVVIDLATGDEITSIDPGGAATTVAFSPDGSDVLVGLESGTVGTFDANSGQEEGSFSAENEAIWSLDVSPDGTYLVTSGADSTVRVWDREGKLMMALPVGGPASFLDDGRIFARGITYPCDVCIPFEALLDLARSRVTRQLTPDERATYLHE